MRKAPSYVSGAADAPLLGKTIGQALDQARRNGASASAVSPAIGMRLTWREFADQVDALAAGLLALGLEPGDRIGIWSLNRAEWTLTQFAAAKAGLILVTINPAYRLSELEYALEQGRLHGAGHRDRVQDQRLYRHDQRAGAGAGASRAGRAHGREAAAARASSSRSAGRERPARSPSTTLPRMGREPSIASCSPRSRTACSSTIRSTSSSPAAPPARRRA